MTWGRERESGIHLPKGSLNSPPGESSCYCRTVGEAAEAAVKEGGQGWGWGPCSPCPEALCTFCILLSPPCWAWPEGLQVNVLTQSLSFCPALPFLSSLITPCSSPTPTLPHFSLSLLLGCAWVYVCVLGLNICNSQLVIRDAMPFLHISSGRLNCAPHL